MKMLLPNSSAFGWPYSIRYHETHNHIEAYLGFRCHVTEAAVPLFWSHYDFPVVTGVSRRVSRNGCYWSGNVLAISNRVMKISQIMDNSNPENNRMIKNREIYLDFFFFFKWKLLTWLSLYPLLLVRVQNKLMKKSDEICERIERNQRQVRLLIKMHEYWMTGCR